MTRHRTIRRSALAAAALLGTIGLSAPASAVTIIAGTTATINFQATTGMAPWDLVSFTPSFSQDNPFGVEETLTFQTFDANGTLLSQGSFNSGRSVFTSGIGAGPRLTAVNGFDASNANRLTTSMFSAVIGASRGSFELTGATADFQSVLAGGRTQNGVVGTFAAPAGAVPEPGTWAMMLLGFGLVGGAMRYRSRRMSVATA